MHVIIRAANLKSWAVFIIQKDCKIGMELWLNAF
jgi:hypothetical protein